MSYICTTAQIYKIFIVFLIFSSNVSKFRNSTLTNKINYILQPVELKNHSNDQKSIKSIILKTQQSKCKSDFI